jgi:phosphomevalonate kinase
MRINATFSAPGKLFVAGEYAVLWGGEALLFGVGPRCFAQVKSRDDRRVDILTVEGRLSGDLTPLGIAWHREVAPGFRFVANAVSLAARVAHKEGPGFSIALSPSAQVGGHKLGLGSSARATVLAVECARVGLGESFDTLKLALVSHSEVQGGKGSGGDVAASFLGGYSKYQFFDTATLRQVGLKRSLHSALKESPPVQLTRLASVKTMFPAVYVFSGFSASTPALIEQAESNRGTHQRASFVVNSNAATRQLEQAIAASDFAAVKAACKELQALLSSLVDQQNASLKQLLNLCEVLGGAVKQSGAGGGDGYIVFTEHDNAKRELMEGLKLRGHHCFEVSIEEGLRREAVAPELFANWFQVLD